MCILSRGEELGAKKNSTLGARPYTLAAMLSQFLISQLFSFLLVFCRLGSAIMLLPGFGEAYVFMRMRLFLAVLFSALLSSVLVALPAAPASIFALVQLMVGEILIGLFIGGVSRIIIASVHIAGTIIAYESSLSSALTQNITSFQGQDSTIGNLLSMTAVVLLFSTDLHHYMLMGLANSYTLFLPGQFPPIADFSHHATLLMSSIFQTAMQIAAPNIVIGLMLYLGAGIISRLMPNMQIFFILMAPQLLISFFILMVCFSSVMLWFNDYFRTSLGGFLNP